MAEARGRAQADTLRATQTRHAGAPDPRLGARRRSARAELRKGDVVLVREGELIPGDGEVVEGVAYVNEAAITGESAPVLKEPGTDIRSLGHRRHPGRQRLAADPDHRRPRPDASSIG